MGLREKINQNPGITTGVTAGIIVLTLLFIVYQNMGGSPSAGLTKAYYTVDDGATYFDDEATKLAPFDYKGKPAYLAHVFKCKGGKPFVQYVERYTDAAKKKIEEARKMKTPDLSVYETVSVDGVEVKPAKSAAKWVKANDPEYNKIITPKCPDGSNTEIEAVVPD